MHVLIVHRNPYAEYGQQPSGHEISPIHGPGRLRFIRALVLHSSPRLSLGSAKELSSRPAFSVTVDGGPQMIQGLEAMLATTDAEYSIMDVAQVERDRRLLSLGVGRAGPFLERALAAGFLAAGTLEDHVRLLYSMMDDGQLARVAAATRIPSGEGI